MGLVYSKPGQMSREWICIWTKNVYMKKNILNKVMKSFSVCSLRMRSLRNFISLSFMSTSVTFLSWFFCTLHQVTWIKSFGNVYALFNPKLKGPPCRIEHFIISGILHFIDFISFLVLYSKPYALWQPCLSHAVLHVYRIILK